MACPGLKIKVKVKFKVKGYGWVEYCLTTGLVLFIVTSSAAR